MQEAFLVIQSSTQPPTRAAVPAVGNPSTTLRLLFNHASAEPQDPERLRHRTSIVQSSCSQLGLDPSFTDKQHGDKTPKRSQSNVMVKGYLPEMDNATDAGPRLSLIVMNGVLM